MAVPPAALYTCNYRCSVITAVITCNYSLRFSVTCNLTSYKSGGCSKRRSIPATVPAAPTPLARSAPPARCPGPISGTIYHVPLLRSPTTTPEPLPLLPLCPTALYHAMLWYTPSMRTRVPSFGQTFPHKVGQKKKKKKKKKKPLCTCTSTNRIVFFAKIQ